jgi:hypothetical protein
MKQTAVEWLVNEIPSIDWENSYWKSRFEQAKELEKQQIIDARQDGYESTYAEYGETPKCYLDGSNEQYYNENFKNK